MDRWNRIKGSAFLLLAALIWGTTFVAQDLISDTVGPITFNGVRMTLGGLVLLPVALWRGKGSLLPRQASGAERRRLFFSGVFCGVALLFAATLQQAGISAGTEAGKSAFITALYVILVPVLGIFLKEKLRLSVFLCAALALVGLFFLCLADFSAAGWGLARGMELSKGDYLTLLCSLIFAVQIIAVDRTAPHMDGVALSVIQFLTGGVLGLVGMLLFENDGWQDIYAARWGILYAAIFSCGFAYTFQILGQKTTPPALASVLMCLESVFAVLSGAVFLGNRMSAEEILGCVLMLCAILITNLADYFPRKKKKEAFVTAPREE